MPSPIKVKAKHRMKRNVNPQINQPELATPILISEAEAVGSVLTLTFDGAVSQMRDTVPQFTTDVVGPEPVSAVQPCPNQVAITFSASVAAATSINIPFRDPAIRNSS